MIGAGGVGGYFGGQLAAAGHDVRFIARGRQAAALSDRGLVILSERAPRSLEPVQASDDIRNVADVDLVLVAVKLWETENIARQVAAVPGPPPAILSLQKGVQKDDDLRRHLPWAGVLGGLCYISAAIESPGAIRHNGSLARIVFGPYGRARSERATAFEQALRDAGVDVELSDEIEEALWRKFVFLVGDERDTPADRRVARIPASRPSSARRHGGSGRARPCVRG